MAQLFPGTVLSLVKKKLTIVQRTIIALAMVVSGCLGVLVVLRLTGLVMFFSIPTGGMTPTLSKGDHVLMEGISFTARKPRRGDVLVFRTGGVSDLPAGQIFVQRAAGLPGDHLRLAEGRFFVNETEVSLGNSTGQIYYASMPNSRNLTSTNDSVTVPEGQYFLLGDNTLDSYDGRYYGSVPVDSILGRMCFRYWPPGRIGAVK